MTRLGLWGIGTSFPGGFQEFMQEIESGGVGAMEMVSRDMKALGMYLSGSISFGVCPQSGKAVEYRERIHRLTPRQRDMYDRAAAAWQSVLRNIDAALQVTNGGPRARAVALNKFWGDHQRFFRQVIGAFKVPSVIAETEAALSQGKSVVISLVGTGEARTEEQVAKATANGAMLEDLDFSPREVIAAMVDRAFPTLLYQDITDPGTGKTVQVPVTDASGIAVHSKEALRMKQQLIDGLSALELPENPLELLKLKVGHLNFSSRPVFYPVRGGSAEIPPNWLIVVQGKGNKYRLIPMNRHVRDTLLSLCHDRTSDAFVFDKDVNEVNDYALRWGFEEACTRAEITFGETVPGGIIWHDLRRTFATRLRANGVHEYDISDLLGHSRSGVTQVYARATRAVLEQAVEKLTEPWGQIIEFERRVG